METFLPYVLNKAIINNEKETLNNLKPFATILYNFIGYNF